VGLDVASLAVGYSRPFLLTAESIWDLVTLSVKRALPLFVTLDSFVGTLVRTVRLSGRKEILATRSERRLIKIFGGKPRCPLCRSEMLWRYSVIRSHKGGYPYRDDQWWKCPRCFNVQLFGVPITRQEYRRELSERGGNILIPEHHPDVEIFRRLKALGYVSE